MNDHQPQNRQVKASVREEGGHRIVLGLRETSPTSKTGLDHVEICLTPEECMRLGHKLIQIGKHLKERSVRQGQQFVRSAAG